VTSTPSARAPTRAREPSASPGENEVPASGLFAVVAGGVTPHHVGRGVSEEVLHIQLAGIVLDRRCLPPWGGGVVAGVGIIGKAQAVGSPRSTSPSPALSLRSLRMDRRFRKRRRATTIQRASTIANGSVPARKPYADEEAHATANRRMNQADRSSSQ
jgi:hypothetical protein